MTMLALSWQKPLRACGWLGVCAMSAAALLAQAPAPRIRAEVTSSQMSILKGSAHPMAQAQYDAGRMPAGTRMSGMTIFFGRSESQQADLDSLIAAQQNPASPLFHQWLTPEQFAARFGMAQADIDKVQTWLEQQGFSVDSVSRSRTMVRFSGTVGQVEQAFATQMHYYNIDGARHFAPSSAISLPAALAPTILAIRNLDDFRPHPMHIRSNAGRARPDFTSSVSGNVFFAPGDIKVAYGLNPLLGASVNGAGQTIAIVGQSSITATDIENFQTAAGLAVKDPTQVLVPGTGTPQAFPGDQGESDLDLEWSGAIAPGADIVFVYTGSDTSFSIFDSIAYAVDQKIGNIISVSYGACETQLTTANANALEAVLSQGATQGQSILAASGDNGSTACFISPTTTNPTLAVQQALAVSYPASSQYATAVGGTEISQSSSAYYTQGSAYWSAQNTSADVITSALQYIPEVVWNDSLASVQAGGGLSATGGGASALFPKPAWQAGVPGIPADGKRDVPDVAFYSSPNYVAYLYCTSDQSDWSTATPPIQQASCNSGFRDSASQTLTLAGGTSFAAPVFAGMVAIINQQKGYVSGAGLINPTLYQLASNSTTYASAFHDVTSGNNFCPSAAGSSFCTGNATSSYAATAGYDLTTGLGSVDVNSLVSATGWPAGPTGVVGTTTSVSASNSSPNTGDNVTFTVTVAPNTGSSTATGTVNLSIDGGGSSYNNGGSTQTVTLGSNGTATYATSFSTAGNHQVVARYVGDTTHAASTGVVSINVQGSNSNTGTFTMSATSVSISQGASGSSTITVTPANGYKGTVNITPTSSSASFCYTTTAAVVSGTAAATASMSIDTNLDDCGGASVRTRGMHLFRAGRTRSQLTHQPLATTARSAFGLAGLFFAGLIGWRFRRSRFVASMIALGIIGFALSGCGGDSSSNSDDTPKGTYTITLTGQDSATSSITATTNFTLTVK
jgi:subtilase family serine protease